MAVLYKDEYNPSIIHYYVFIIIICFFVTLKGIIHKTFSWALGTDFWL